MRKILLLSCLISAHSFAYPIIYTIDGSEPVEGSTYKFTTSFMLDTDQVGRRYIDGVAQEIAGSWFASILSFDDSEGNSFSFSPENDKVNGSYYASPAATTNGTGGYTHLHFAENNLFEIDMLAINLYPHWAIGTLFEVNVFSDVLPTKANYGRISSVPEPWSISLMLTGLGGIIATRRLKR